MHEQYLMKLPIKISLIFLFSCSIDITAMAFQSGINHDINTIKPAFENYRDHTLQEKLYVHFDRQFYLTGETVWFKIYYVDGATHQALNMSKVAYLEVIDANQNSLFQAKVALTNGFGEGSLKLPVSLNAGNYLVRAYTNWMKNFDPDFFFKTSITIVNPFKKLGLTSVDNENHYDAQFLPEGGNMVYGLESTIAFRVISEEGKGMDFQGKLLEDNGNVIADFKPLKFGMGQFRFAPEPGHLYHTVIIDKDSTIQKFNLPQPNTSGIVMHVTRQNAQGVDVAVSATSDLENSKIYLLAQCRGIVGFTQNGQIQHGETSFFIPEDRLGDGIVQITLFNGNGQPICERLLFNRPNDKLKVQVKTNKPSYQAREKVTLDLATALNNIDTLTTHLSMSVFLYDSLQRRGHQDILSYLLLSSDLKGQIENPDYYFNSIDPQTDEALDNLMLTQGWRRFVWRDVFNDSIPEMSFVPEFRGQLVQGSIINKITHNPVADTMVYLSIPARYTRFYSSKSDRYGNIQFELKDFYGPQQIIIRPEYDINNKYEITLRNVFAENPTNFPLSPLFLNEHQRGYIQQCSINMQVADAYKKVSPLNIEILPGDTSNFYGKPDERYFLDDYVRFPVMEEVMREYVAGVLVRKRKGKFHFVVINLPHKTIFENDPLVLLDGVPIFDIDQIMAFDPLKIQRLDVMKREYFYGSTSYDGVVSFATYKGDLAGFEFKDNAIIMDYRGFQPEKEFYAPKYETHDELISPIPDFRNLLYWNPDITTKGKDPIKLEFYTSDQVGKYMISIEGITSDGHPGSATTTFEVTPRQEQP